MLLPRKPLPRLYYGWVIVAIAFASCAVISATWGSFAVFYVAFVEEFGWSRTTTAGALSVFVAMSGLTASPAGWLVDRFGPRRIMPLGAVILAAGLVLTSRISEPLHLYLTYGVLTPLGLNCAGTVPHLRLLSNWFERDRGTAFGVATAGYGIGSVVLLPTIQFLVLQFGWRDAYLAMAGFVLLLAPLTGFFHRRHPADLGLLPDGRKESPLGGATTGNGYLENGPLGSRSLREAMSTSNFWVIFGMNACMSFIALVGVFQIAHIVGIGFQPMLAATISGLAGLLNAFGRVLGGFLSDRIGKIFVGFMGVLLLSLGVSATILAGIVNEPWLLFAFSLLYGLGWGTLAIAAQAVVAELYRGKNYSTVAGFLEVGVGIGGFIGPWLGGFMFDRSGTYAWAFLVAIASAWATAAMFRLAYWGVVRPKPLTARRSQSY